MEPCAAVIFFSAPWLRFFQRGLQEVAYYAPARGKESERMKPDNDLIPIPHSGSTAIELVRSRIHYKMRDYASYRFTAPQSCAINIFFDLAQEFDELEQIQLLGVLILRMFFQYDAELFLKNDQNQLALVTPAVNPEFISVPDLRTEVWRDGSRCYVPVRGKSALVVTGDQRIITNEDLMGVLVIYVNKLFESHELLFLEKFANRVGFSLHNKLLAQRNARHVLFLRKLAHDIGHNIITPNMRLKLMLHQLEGHLNILKDLCASPLDEAGMHDLRVLQQKMTDHTKAIVGNFTNSALFLESLLRQSHFDLGHYVLRRARLDISALVLIPQFERYRSNLEELNLHIDEHQPSHPAEPCMVMADLGLISQVLANFLSNAVKYTRPSRPGGQGEVRCGVEVVPDAFGKGEDGAKVSVFSSGPHIPPEEAAKLFEDNYRASNSAGQYGTGHGLFFVREIITEHQGKVGYEPAAGGNIFYFTLPVVE